MKKIICFFFDIVGTIDGNKENSIADYEKLCYLLNKIKEDKNVDLVIFSLLSNHNKDFVNYKQNSLKIYLENYVIFGKQFFENGYILNNDFYFQKNNGKINCLLNYIFELKKEYIIDEIYYVDDCLFYHEILHTLNLEKLNLNITSIIPNNKNGLIEVNSILEKKLNSNNKKKILK